MEVALLSELDFKHQVTSDHSSGEGGRQGEGGHDSTGVPGCPEDKKWEGGRGVHLAGAATSIIFVVTSLS